MWQTDYAVLWFFFLFSPESKSHPALDILFYIFTSIKSHAITAPRFDYCNSQYYGISYAFLLQSRWSRILQPGSQMDPINGPHYAGTTFTDSVTVIELTNAYCLFTNLHHSLAYLYIQYMKFLVHLIYPNPCVYWSETPWLWKHPQYIQG